MKLRDIIIFIAGAEFFHTLSHIMIVFMIPLPLDLGFMILSSGINYGAIVINAIITIGLIYWAKKLTDK